MSTASAARIRSAFVAGATGYTGRAVVRELGARGIATVAHVRPDSARLEEWSARFAAMGAVVDATPRDDGAMAATLTRLRPDVVFALLGTTRARGARGDRVGAESASYETVDYGLTAMLLRAALAAGHRPRFVYLSSAGTGPDARGAYLAARWRVERELRASALPFAVARPSFITGDDRDESRPGERIGATVVDGLLAVAGTLGAEGLRERWRSTSNARLAAALVTLAMDDDPAIVAESDALRRLGGAGAL